MTWLNIDTLDLKYRKGQIWRISDTCYVYDVQEGDILNIPFVVSHEYQDVLVGYNLTDVTLEQVLERKALWVQKQYATFYDALNEFAKLSAGAIEYVGLQRVRINITGRVMLVRQSTMRQQKFLQLAQNNPMQAMQYLLHRIQTEPTAVVPVMRGKVVVSEVPKLHEEPEVPIVPEIPKQPKVLDVSLLENYKPITALSTSLGTNKENPAFKELLSKLHFEIDDFSTRAIEYIYALCSVQTYKAFKEKYQLSAFNQVPFIDPASLLAAGRYSGTFNSYSRVFGVGENLQAYTDTTVKTVGLDAIPEQSDSIIRCPLQETLVGTICLWLVPKHLNTHLKSSIGVAPVKYVYDIGLSPEILQVSRYTYRDTSTSKQDYMHTLSTTGAGVRPKPTGAVGAILDYSASDTVTYTMQQDAYGETTVRFKGTQSSSKAGLSDWSTKFDVSRVLRTYTKDETYDNSDVQLFKDVVAHTISPAYKEMVRYLTSTGRGYNDYTTHSARNGSYAFLEDDYSTLQYPTRVPPDPYPKSSNVEAALSYSGLVSLALDLELELLPQYEDELDDLNHINRLLYTTAEDATVTLQYKYIPTFKFNAASSLDSLLFKARGNNGSQ
ncbi:MAG: hypothetical protein D8B41_02635 [Porphyromonas sp.]|nr:MAG: hypothetical protein D8B41_02635 [Porphyromonas sp.]